VLQDELLTMAARAGRMTNIVLTLPSGATVSFSADTPPDELRRHVTALGLDNPLSPYLTTKQAAQYLQISVRNVHRLVEENQLPVDRVGRRLVFHRDKLDEWVATRGGEEAA
jgi:excisionase family DNA binding protein